MTQLKPDELYISVSLLAQQIRTTLEIGFNQIRVKGEVVQPKQYQSGLYFTLKDGLHSLDCVAWKDIQLDPIPTEGVELICSGRLTTYSGRSKYQLNVTKVEAFGIGVLLKTIEERRIRLLKEGLFDRQKKPPIPKLPKHIGIITSKTGSVLQDMMHRLRDRYPIRVTLYPIQVQGVESPSQAISGIKYLSSRVDLIILARGGGSFEDLVGFNDEALVRVVASSRTPIVTGIGHETDTTLVDYASTMRAPTPTAAIEMSTPRINDLIKIISDFEKQIKLSTKNKLDNAYLQVSSFKLDKDSFLRLLSQKLDYVSSDLRNSIKQYLLTQKQRVQFNQVSIKNNLQNLDTILQATRERHHKVPREFVLKKQLEVEKLQNWSSTGGYTISDGVKPIFTREAAIKAKTLSIHFHDGAVQVKVINPKIP